ncbi:PREDICTED: uncharacterized protein At5g41620-like isoform X2 [Ipomoea nil]|uniref:uncharacterized protein At5g41620-like isoform X2 n=1 Tax=Ipomoea nil TaxID=35883 RepID=UPI000901484C|nr:PREDICTED: uncharacterized protein At5g41620-like isoform X2 [Ipomoea nil]
MDTKRSENGSFSSEILQRMGSDNGKELSSSARKLVAFWEIKGAAALGKEENLQERNGGEMGRKERSLKSSKHGSSKASQLSDPIYSPVSERTERSKVEMSHRRIPSFGTQKVLQNDYFLQVDDNNNMQQTGGSSSQTRHLLKDVSHSLTTSKQLLKVLSRVWSIEEQKTTCISLFSTLKSELDRACIQVTKLIQERRHNHSEVDALLKWFEEQKAVWRMKEHCKVQSALTSLVGELKTEKRLRRQAERLNKKLGRELSDTKTSLNMAVKEVESQKRAMEVLERVCEELAKGVGEDKAKLEELKKESAKAREEVEKEREMLQFADILREERVQMKLSEAKYQYEEKTAVLERLKTEMEACLSSKSCEGSLSQSPNNEKIKALQKHFRETLPASGHFPDKNEREESDSADEEDSELHCIELNMDETSKSYEWRNSSNPPTTSQERRQSSDPIEWEFISNGGLFESGSSEPWRNEFEDEIERYHMIKDLRDHFVSAASKIPPPSQDFVTPT